MHQPTGSLTWWIQKRLVCLKSETGCSWKGLPSHFTTQQHLNSPAITLSYYLLWNAVITLSSIAWRLDYYTLTLWIPHCHKQTVPKTQFRVGRETFQYFMLVLTVCCGCKSEGSAVFSKWMQLFWIEADSQRWLRFCLEQIVMLTK